VALRVLVKFLLSMGRDEIGVSGGQHDLVHSKSPLAGLHRQPAAAIGSVQTGGGSADAVYLDRGRDTSAKMVEHLAQVTAIVAALRVVGGLKL
jgi:hypothetical protein